jgi:3-hydroxybutyryl-CoA dehydratase
LIGTRRHSERPERRLTAHYTVETVDKERGRSIAKVEVVNQHGERVAVAEHIMRWAKKLSAAAA